MQCNQFRPGFELASPCLFPTTITTTPRAPPTSLDGKSWNRWYQTMHTKFKTFIRKSIPLLKTWAFYLAYQNCRHHWICVFGNIIYKIFPEKFKLKPTLELQYHDLFFFSFFGNTPEPIRRDGGDFITKKYISLMQQGNCKNEMKWTTAFHLAMHETFSKTSSFRAKTFRLL